MSSTYAAINALRTSERLLRELLDEATQEWHRAETGVIYEHSGNTSKDLRELRVRVNELRAAGGLGPSPIEPLYSEQEQD